MKHLLLAAGLLCYLAPSSCWSQTDSLLAPAAQRQQPSDCARVSDLQVARGTESATALAEQDIQAHTPYLIILSGEAFTRLTPAHRAFEQRFNVKYHQVGCLVRSVDEAVDYNTRVFAYLHTTYGKAWRRKIWASVAGWEEWKRSH